MPRANVSVECGSGTVCVDLPDRILRLSLKEAEMLYKGLEWALKASAQETHQRNQRRRVETYYASGKTH